MKPRADAGRGKWCESLRHEPRNCSREHITGARGGKRGGCHGQHGKTPAGFRNDRWNWHASNPEIDWMVERVAAVRDAVGPSVDLAIDMHGRYDIASGIAVAKAMEPFRLLWLEEPVPPDRIGAYAEIRRQTGIPIAGGEHEYTRWGFKVLLDAEGVDVIQADPDWTGGLSEMVKICALASAYGVQVIPHGHSVLPALHVIAAQSPEVCPLLEYLILHNARKQWFHTVQYAPAHGMVALPTMPGLGIALDPERVHRRTELHWA